jgi:hypothetical protein
MLMTMERRSFVVTVAYLKTESLLVAVMGLVFLGDPLTVMTMRGDWHRHGGRGADFGEGRSAARPIFLGRGRRGSLRLLGLSSAPPCLPTSASGYRGAILALHSPGALLPATFSLAVGLTLQTVLLLAWLLVMRRDDPASDLRSVATVAAGGLCRRGGLGNVVPRFSLATAASVRTLALVEVLVRAWL